MSIGQKFEGESFLKISLFGPTSPKTAINYDSIEHLIDFKAPIKGDVLKLECLNKYIKAKETCRFGSILSDGEFNLFEFQPKDIIDLYLDKRLETSDKLTRISKCVPISFKF